MARAVTLRLCCFAQQRMKSGEYTLTASDSRKAGESTRRHGLARKNWGRVWEMEGRERTSEAQGQVEWQLLHRAWVLCYSNAKHRGLPKHLAVVARVRCLGKRVSSTSDREAGRTGLGESDARDGRRRGKDSWIARGLRMALSVSVKEGQTSTTRGNQRSSPRHRGM